MDPKSRSQSIAVSPREAFPKRPDKSAFEIGKRLAEVRDQFDWARIQPTLDELEGLHRSLQAVLERGKSWNILSKEEWIDARGHWMGRHSARSLQLRSLQAEIKFVVQSDLIQAREEGVLSAEEFKQQADREMPEGERGARLKRAVIECREGLRAFDPGPDPIGIIVKRLAQRCCDEIIQELARLKILDLCAYCRNPFFPTSERKTRCSLEFEGSDCSTKHRVRKSYHKKKGSTR